MRIWERSHEHKLYRMVLASFNSVEVTVFFFLINMIDCNKFVVLNVTSKPLEANCCSVVDSLA